VIYLKKKMPILIISAVALLVGIYFLFFRILFHGGDYQKKVLEIRSQEVNVEMVKSALAKARGLSIKESIADDYGMLFVFNDSAVRKFWMKDMKFPIDIIWISGGKVIGFEENIWPESGVSDWQLKSYYSPAPADKVLEMTAGSVRRLGIIPGTEIGGL